MHMQYDSVRNVWTAIIGGELETFTAEEAREMWGMEVELKEAA